MGWGDKSIKSHLIPVRYTRVDRVRFTRGFPKLRRTGIESLEEKPLALRTSMAIIEKLFDPSRYSLLPRVSPIQQ